MKAGVFLREENKFKEVEITDPTKPEIGDKTLNKWQNIINIIADIIGVSAGLIMHITPETMEVVLKSENERNPYQVGGNDTLGHGLYCETVIGRNEELYIKNALDNQDWKDNPDIKLDMISYCGFPIRWPDDEFFGTICILDDKTMELDKNQKKLLAGFKDVIEGDLSLLINRQNLKTKSKAVETAIAGISFLNMQGEIVYANKSFLKMFGYKEAEELYNAKITPFDLIPKTEFEKAKNGIAATIKKGKWQGESQAVKVNGKVIDIKLSSSLVKNKNKPMFIMASFEDITDRKEKEKIMKDQNEKIIKQKNRLNWIIEGTDAGIWEWNIQTGKTEFNNKWAETLGYNLKEISPTTIDTWKKFTHPEDLKKAEKELEKHFRGETSQYDVEIRMKHKRGHWIWINDRGKVISWTEDNKPHKMYGIHLNIAKQKRQLQFQKTLAEISSSLLDISSSNIDRKINDSLKKIGKFFNIDRSYIFQLSEDNKSMSNTHEWCKEGVKSQKKQLQNLKVDLFPWAVEQLYNNEIINIKDVENMSSNKEAEKELLKSLNLRSLVVKPMFIENNLFGFFGFDSVKKKKEFSGEKIRLLKIFTDVITSAFSKFIDEKRIIKLNYHDSLTGLYNRRFFEKELDRLDTKRQLPLSIIMADINGLKIINDSLGHKKGDQLLIKSAETLKKVLREEDILARQGGDEFAILLPQTGKKEAEKIIKRIKIISRKTNTDDLTVSMALGTATKTDANHDKYDILKKADNNMYQNKLSESKSTKSKIVKSLLNTLEVKSNETKEHALRMTKLSFDFGEKLGLSNSELNRLSLLSTLHDIGKTTIAEEILKKPGKLTKEEWEIIKRHPERGYRIANSSEEFALIAEEIYTHHEKWDGSGYPRQLAGKDIPYLARIISIIDAFDVMTNGRPYKKALSREESLAEIKRCAGQQFDPELAVLFIEMFTK
ncbi:MAG: HD domain-containing phosphohydrolase [Bacillota bacterium]